MSKLLRRLHRIRKHLAEEARVELVEAERAAQSQQATVTDLLDAMHRAQPTGGETAQDLATRHQFVQHTTQRLRIEEQTLAERHEAAEERRDRTRELAVDARLIETVAERRDLEAASQADRRDRQALDEAGLQGWATRTVESAV